MQRSTPYQPEAARPCRQPDEAANRQIGRDKAFKLEKLCRFCRINRRGAAAVEFAVIAPVFFLLVFGMIEFGRMIMVQQIITNAAREGARIAVLDGATTHGSGGVANTVDEYLEGAGIRGATVTVIPDPPDSAGWGEPVTVTVSIPFSQVSWLPTPMFVGGDTELSSKSTMRRETVQ
ncbi:MAG: TadE/TadG family type IV pilus assembly protein [Patescibacteria group bacterium]|nr:TadE/TadG family type IV pilus assembly protein [Patescibacteria group bacterium]